MPKSKDVDLRKEIKNTFRGYRTMTKAIRRKLYALGFSIQDGGKHYKLYYMGNFDQPFTLSKTSGDFRSGRNFSAHLIAALGA